ncbi:Synaptojanin-2 [Paramecium bursaria]
MHIKIYQSASRFIIEPNPTTTHINFNISIDKQTFKIQEHQQKIEYINPINAYGIVGTIKYQSKFVLIYVEQAKMINNNIFQVVKANYIDQESDYLDALCSYLSNTFYFSFTQDICKSQQFWWNRNMIKFFPPKYQIKFIQGYVGFYQSQLKYSQLEYLLITRRSCKKSGFIINDTGLDQDGNASNYCETEQIVQYNNIAVSQTISRGSLPLVWTKSLWSNDILLSKDPDKPLMKHISQILENYKYLLIINMIDDYNLSQYLEFKKDIKYVQFNIADILNTQQFNNKVTNIKNFIDYSKEQRQKTLIRINCFDCLEMTNIYMQKLAIYSLQMMLPQLEKEFNCDDFSKQSDSTAFHTSHPFFTYFKQLWAENLYNLQLVYSHKLHQSQSTKGLQQLLVLLNETKVKQDIINNIVGTNNQLIQEHIMVVEKEIKKKSLDNILLKNIQIYVITWNINAHSPQGDYDNLFDFQQQPEIIVIGFQEFVALNAGNILRSNNRESIQIWKGIFLKILGDSYSLIVYQDMVGIFVLIFVLKTEQSQFVNINTEIVKYGFGQLLGNKGAVIIRMKYYDSNICFINCHLPAGQKHNDDRLAAFDYIHSKLEGQQIDWIITFGDMNFRINLPYNKVIQSLQQYHGSQIKEHRDAILNMLKEYDQLRMERHKSRFLKKYIEAQIQFTPTYKFDIGTESYDTIKKRVPSFTDRILLWRLQRVENHVAIKYHTLQGNFQVSDHRPVSCLIQSQVCIYLDKQDDHIEYQQTQQKEIYFRKLEQIHCNTFYSVRNRKEITKQIDQDIIDKVTNPFDV